MPRTLSPAEKTHLARYKPEALEDIDSYGEMPVEYISGTTEFDGLLFTVTPDVLIPRLETEELVAMAYREILEQLNTSTLQQLNICELGTGSGAVSIALAYKLSRQPRPSALAQDERQVNSNVAHGFFNIIASDVSESAVQVAQQNVHNLLNKKLRQQNYELLLIVSDLFSQYPSNQTFDLIIANLPYIPQERIAYLDSSVKDFEPHVALDGGPSGLDLIKKMLNQAVNHSHQGTVIFLEVDYTHTKIEFTEFESTWQIEEIEDQFHRQRFIKLTKV